MSDDDNPHDKPHDATPRKLEEARNKGEIVRSSDLNTAITYGGFLVSGVMLTPLALEGLGNLMRRSLGQADVLAPLILAPGGTGPAAGLLRDSTGSAAMIMALPGALLLVALFAQRALLFTPSNLAPKGSRISPLSNARTKFGSQGLFQFAKSAVKLALISVLLAMFLWARSEVILTTIYASPGQMLAILGDLTLDFLIVVTAIAAVMGAVDWGWEFSQHMLRNRMDRQELMDEAKSSEGDPHMKSQRRQRGQAIAMNQMLADVPKSDVVVVNPTHYAVALSWDRAKGGVPICVAKGVDEIAARIRETAAEAGVPIFSDPPTARALHATVDLGQPIAPDQYRAVAAAIRFADLMRQKAREAGRR